MAPETFIWLVFFSCLLLSFVLSGMEAGVFALSRLRIRQQMRVGRLSARALHRYLENPENFLWTILVGNTVANFFILGWLVVVLRHWVGGHPFWFIVAYAAAAVLLYAFFDLLPKMLFRQFPTRLCLALARPFGVLRWVLRPLVAAVEWCSELLLRWRGGKVFTGHLFGNREELRLVMQESSQGLTSEERLMINRVLDLPSLTVRQAMSPLEQAATVSAQTSIREVFDLVRQRKVTRLPVWEIREGVRRIIGLVQADLLLFQSGLDLARPVSEHLKPALYLEEDLRLELALRRMQRSGQRLAVVLGRDRREIGLLSFEDVLKVIFGQVSL